MNKFATIIISIFITIFLILSGVKLTLNFRQLYYIDIKVLNIQKQANMTRTDIINNYDSLIDYLKPSYVGELKLPTLHMSDEGKIHFEDVKNIFVKLEYIMFGSLVLSIIGVYYLFKKKDFLFFKYSSILLIGIPIFLFFPLVINFNEVFTYFHKLLFRNDYWLLDPVKDPIINLLPEPYFMHAAILILIIIALESYILYRLYKYFLTKHVKSL